MIEFDHIIQNAAGLHARTAGRLVRELRGYGSTVTISSGERSADASGVMALMCICAGCGDKITARICGSDEEECAKAVRAFFEKEL